MKKLAIWLGIVAIASACKSTSVEKDNLIHYQETVTINDVPKTSLTFYGVSDSRCPENVQCVWAGYVNVDLELTGVSTEGRISEHVKMCLGDCDLIQNRKYKITDTLDHNFAGQDYRFILSQVNRPALADSAAGVKAYTIALDVQKR